MVHEYGASSAQFDPDRIAELRPPPRLVGARPGCDRLPRLVLDRRRARGLRPGAVRPPAARDPVRRDRSHRCVAAAWPGPRRAAPRRSDRSATSSTRWPGTDRRPWPRSPSRTSTSTRTTRSRYGLDAAPAGPYEPAERVWTPERDPRPLVRGLAQRVRARGAGRRVGRLPARAARRPLAGRGAADRARAADLDVVVAAPPADELLARCAPTTPPAEAASGCRCRPTRPLPELGATRRLPSRRSRAGGSTRRAPVRPAVGTVRGRRRAPPARRRRNARHALGPPRRRRR